jgi:hypothetical protein
VLLVFPSLGLLSVLRSKVPWVVIALFPAWATLAAIAMGLAMGCARRWSTGSVRWRKTSAIALAVCVMLVALLGVVGGDYESALRAASEDQWRGASHSRAAADAMNELCHDGERALVTSFYYWKGIPPGHPCPIFAYYFVRKVEVLIRSHERSFPELLGDIREYRLDWALLSPTPGESEYAIFGGFEGQLGLRPHKLSGAFLFQTKEGHQTK